MRVKTASFHTLVMPDAEFHIRKGNVGLVLGLNGEDRMPDDVLAQTVMGFAGSLYNEEAQGTA